LSIQPPPP